MSEYIYVVSCCSLNCKPAKNEKRKEKMNSSLVGPFFCLPLIVCPSLLVGIDSEKTRRLSGFLTCDDDDDDESTTRKEEHARATYLLCVPIEF